MAGANLNISLTDKHKKLILNVVVLVVAFMIASNIYKKQMEQRKSLMKEKENEVKKNALLEKIGALEKDTRYLKQLVNKKDSSMLISNISAIAKEQNIKINSVKPKKEEDMQTFYKYSFSLNITAESYYKMARFMLALENSTDIYVVENIGIRKQEGGGGYSGYQARTAEDTNPDSLSADLTISTILMKD